MKTVKIMLGTINDVKTFVNTVAKYDFDVDLVSGRYAVDAKSIMGIFSLDLSKPIELQAHTDSPEAFFAEIKPFIVE
ncbi:MAG TPA: HPr family phosphocarrier protein [Oscillospiraceae bacterium]|jgi:phosphotransferase system HPr-like phosphotransfer protein|nr:hPr [Oscillospiraceae bacterium]HOV41595.1 HPr family phosphocarrier protein [Oscillospiraceae bacterium]